jgi:hypothetical protein
MLFHKTDWWEREMGFKERTSERPHMPSTRPSIHPLRIIPINREVFPPPDRYVVIETLR